MPKILLGLTDEMDNVVRYACKLEAKKQGKENMPLGPYVEGLLGKIPTIQRAARAASVKLPKRIPDARGRYDRK